MRMNGQDIIDYINNINTFDLLKKIEKYKKIDLKKMSFEKLSFELRKTINSYFCSTSLLMNGTYLYRIRKMKDLSNLPKKFEDVWYPKACYVTKEGRVNRKGQPVLYCSLDMVTPIYECGIGENDYYAIIQYCVKKNINASLIVNEAIPEGLNQVGELNHRIINNFITNEFCKPVSKDTDFLYKTSILFCEDFFDVPFCDAFLYPSVATCKKSFNIAIKSQIVDEKIVFNTVIICKRGQFNETSNSFSFQAIHKAILRNDNTLKYLF